MSRVKCHHSSARGLKPCFSILKASNGVADTNELFIRSYQMMQMFEKKAAPVAEKTSALTSPRMQTMKEIQRTESYDDTSELYGNSLEYSTEEEPSYLLAQRLISSISNDIKETLNEPEKNSLKPDEIKVGQALILLLDNWEEVLPISGSDKLQKSVVLYFLRETTMMTTKEIRENMKKFKKAYYIIKKSMT